MKNLLYIFLLFTNYHLFYTQKITILDSINKQPLPYCRIINNNTEFYTDSLGCFTFKNFQKNTIIKKGGYYDKIINNFQHIIYLNPKTIEINEINLNQKKEYLIKNKKKNNSTIEVGNTFMTGKIITNPFNKDVLIKDLIIPIHKNWGNKNDLLVINFHSINKENGEIQKNPYKENEIIVKLSDIKSKNNVIRISDKKIILPPNGILVSFKIVKEIGKENLLNENKTLTIYKSATNENLYIFDIKSNKWILLKNAPAYAISLNILQ